MNVSQKNVNIELKKKITLQKQANEAMYFRNTYK